MPGQTEGQLDGWRDGQRDGQKKGRMEGHKFYRTLEPFVGPFRLPPQVQKSNKYSASKAKITLINIKNIKIFILQRKLYKDKNILFQHRINIVF